MGCGCMKEIGGYIELDTYIGREYHEGALALNSGRNALIYLIRAKQMKKLYLPYYCCSSIFDSCKKESVDISYYPIDKSLRPILQKELAKDQWLYIINYYGQLSNQEIAGYKEQYQRVIVDSAQAFYQPFVPGVDTIYTCRKFFGVADGAYLYTDAEEISLERGYSYDKMLFLHGRYEKTANEFYGGYVENNRRMQTEPLQLMSKLTQNLLRGLDYDRIAEIRENNFRYLHHVLEKINEINVIIPYGAFAYPLYVKNGKLIREALRKKRIYIPVLWPNVCNMCKKSQFEYDLTWNLLPLPVDQRYDRSDMDVILNTLGELLFENCGMEVRQK